VGALEKGVSVRSLREAIDGDDGALQAQLFSLDTSNPMVALNSAMLTDGVVIDIADGTVLSQPLHIVHIAAGATASSMFTRSLLRLGKNVSATLVESYVAADGTKNYQAHDSLVIALGDNSRLDHVRLVEDAADAVNISSSAVTLGAHAHFNTFGLTSGAAVSRYHANIAVPGEGPRAESHRLNPAHCPP